MKDTIKKYWFLGLVGIGLFVYLIVYAVQAYQARPVYVDAKEVDGQSVVYTLDEENYFADDLYEDLYDNYVITAAYYKWSMKVIEAAVETTDDLTTYATNYAAYIQQSNDEETIDNYLIQYGYTNGFDDLYQYSLDMAKADQIYRDFYKENYDTYAPNVIASSSPKKIYQILVQVADVTESTDEDGNTIYTANMTEEEQAQYDYVVEALKTQDYETVAKNFYKEYYDDDTDGYLGIYSSTTAPEKYVTEFSDAVIALDYGEVSEPVLSQYGYHFIKVLQPTDEELKADDTFISEVTSFYSYASVVAINDKAEELGFKVVNEDLAERIQTLLDSADAELAQYATTEESEVSE